MHPARVKSAKLLLRLYIAGEGPNSMRAVANLTSICKEHFESKHELEIVDMLTHPMRALADGVIVTPTLLKLSPLPIRKLIGDLSDTSRVLTMLASK